MNISTVNELIRSLESAGELSIKETKVMALAKAYQQLAAENVGLKEYRPEPYGIAMMEALDAFFADEEVPERAMMEAFEILCAKRMPVQATDRIVAEAEARGIEKGIAHLENKFSNIGVQIMNLQWLADSLRGGNGE
ncbi:hypothetical protein [Klebsiella oxytoca]|uniref:hypothetical protein n=1 Tax=Klebsiella oxytoca TaxID=571 RepID=UPI0007CBB079|nr:hypothetical protein [Klebsiella oxytoca]SAQ44104.1 Uncharacterised protein [Klebsiella oxytoca]SAQ49256.1 Uncharacterised protein [Klebsiella oxytoca]